MKHRIASHVRIEPHKFRIAVELIPDTEEEKTAIKNLAQERSSQQQREMIDNYLNFQLNLGNYSVIDLMEQKESLFILNIFI